MFLDLLVMFSVFLLTSFALFRWKRRRLYEMAAKFDGPPTIPFFGNALMYVGLKHKNIVKKSYGGIFDRPSPCKLWLVHKLYFIVFDPVNFETILNSQHALEKHEMYKFSLAGSVGLFNAKVPMWKKHKKIILPTFNQKILDGFVSIFSKQGDTLVDNLEKYAGKGIFDVFDDINIFAINTILETMLGHELPTQKGLPEFAYMLNAFMEIVCARITFNLLYYFDFTFKMTKKGKEFYDHIKNAKNFLQDIITKQKSYYERIKKENYKAETEEVRTERNVFLQELIEWSGKENGLTDSEILDETSIMMLAGSDTTATMNCYILMILGMYPEIQEKVYKEVIDTVGFDRPIEHTDLQNLSYTELVIKETLRILPVAPVIARSTTEDIELKDGRVIPKDSSVVFSIINVHRNPKYWPDPLKFDPLRFLPEECAKRHRYAFIPFSVGPRKCIGIQYAMISMKLTIAMVVRKYVIKTCYKEPNDIKLIQNIVSKPVNGFPISIEKRDVNNSTII